MWKPLQALLDSPNGETRRPLIGANFESNVRGLYIVGDLAGAPVVKLAMAQGHDVAVHIAGLADARSDRTETVDKDAFDVIVVGAGAAGLNAALELRDRGLRVMVLEKNKVASTIEDFPEGKWVYAEPESAPAKGKLWLEGAPKEDLLGRWHAIVRDDKLDVRTMEGLEKLERDGDHFRVRTGKATYAARRVILATGQRGNPRTLGVPGEDGMRVYHRLYSPGHYEGEQILVVGGGNSAVEAALALAEKNRVTLSYRGREFGRLFRENARRLEAARAAGKIEVVTESSVQSFGEDTCVLEARGKREERRFSHAFVLIGAELPAGFLRSLGIRLENEWNWQRWMMLAISFAIAYTIYGVKRGAGAEFWPYTGWGYKYFSFGGRPPGFWYTALYTVVVTVFGLQAMKRWGLDKKGNFQILRYSSLIGFQWIFFFLIPEFLFQTIVRSPVLGELGKDPNFANNAWRSYGLIYAWPLFFTTFFGSPHRIWEVWGVLLSFVILPILALFHGKRYCSWICGCGGLAETLGDRWRHLAPKGRQSIRWEWMNGAVLAAAALITVGILLGDLVPKLRQPAGLGGQWYGVIVDVWLVGIIPVTLYPFFGGKVWCRFWCPLAKLMEIYSRVFTRFRASRFAIHSNEKCISCGECSRNCQVGINVMQFAMKQQVLHNGNSSCIGCGICVTVCPMQVLSFQPQSSQKLVQIQHSPA
ncbi:MAG: NAD(P)-binding domain-containing protein [Bryobacteraceae bacterium]